jgi:hypothetical protein
MGLKAPPLGLASIALPILMAGLWFFFERNPDIGDGLNGYLGMFIFIFLLLGTAISVGAGFLLGVAGLVRREKTRSLAVLGIIVNGVILLLVLG